MAGLATALRVATANRGLSGPHHMWRSVYHEIRWNVEISTISNGIHDAGSDDMPAFLDDADEEEQREPIPALQDTTPEPARQTPPAPRVEQARRAATTAPTRPRGLPREKLQEIAD